MDNKWDAVFERVSCCDSKVCCDSKAAVAFASAAITLTDCLNSAKALASASVSAF
jgi:hypothetical protein